MEGYNEEGLQHIISIYTKMYKTKLFATFLNNFVILVSQFSFKTKLYPSVFD